MNKEYKILEQVIEDLKSTGKVRLSRSEFRYYDQSVTDELLSKVQQVKIDEGILSFYRQIDFVDLQWYAAGNSDLQYMDADEDFVEGHVKIPPFTELVDSITAGNSASVIDPNHHLDDEDYDKLKAHLPFDILNGDGAVTLKRENGIIKDELFFVSIGNESFIKSLGISTKAYLTEGAKYYFFHNWQKAFLIGNENEKTLISHYLKQLKQ
jgi:hypothetical protein